MLPAKQQRKYLAWNVAAGVLVGSAVDLCGARGGNTPSNAPTDPHLWKRLRKWWSVAARGVPPNRTSSSFHIWWRLYTSWPCWTNSCFIMERFEIYCKIQNRLIFIMIIKTSLHLEKNNKRHACTKAFPTLEKCEEKPHLEALVQRWGPLQHGAVFGTC